MATTATVPIDALLEAGVHFGHRTSRWNPKMAPYIYGKRNRIHIIDLKETLRGLIRATHFLRRVAAQGRQILLVGTKRQARGLIEEAARSLDMPYVSDRWIGGLLTNHDVVRRRLERLFELERLEAEGAVHQFSKKELSSLRREQRRILRNLDGVRNMEGLPGALLVIDPNRERTAVLEANRLEIPLVALLDTDCDPELVDIPIPGNDDAMRSIQVILQQLVEAIREGRQAWEEQRAAEERARAEREAQERARAEAIEAARRRRAAERAAEAARTAAVPPPPPPETTAGPADAGPEAAPSSGGGTPTEGGEPGPA